MTAPVSKAEGRCSGELCWYTLPLVDGMVVAHSKSGVLDDCEGAGRPPLAVTAPVSSDLAWLDDLERAHAAATPGPWENPYPFTKLIDAPGSSDNLAIVQCDSAADAAAIVAEHNALPTLIAELRKRDAALKAVEELAADYDDGSEWGMATHPGHAIRDRIRSTLTAALSPESVQS